MTAAGRVSTPAAADVPAAEAIDSGHSWPVLNYPDWRETAATLQLWTQIVGKVRLALSPWLNHGWHVPLYVNARGLGTSLIDDGRRVFEIDFDFVDHRLVIRTPEANDRGFGLEPMSVASFYRQLMAALGAASIDVTINLWPNEVPDPIRFPDDELHRSYDPSAANAFWRVLVHADRAFRLFRTAFLGKTSPVHFFWAASTSPSPDFPDAVHRRIPAVFPACRMPSRARPTRTR